MIIILFLISLFHENDMVCITFKVNTAHIDKSSALYITGNHQNLGEWNPGKVKLQRRDGNHWTIKISLEKGFPLEFKFTRGTWQTEEVAKNGKIPSNHFLKAKKDTTLVFMLDHWKDEFHYPPAGHITGTLRYHRGMKGPGLKPRDIIIWLPPDYEKEKKKRYPVFYMQDGRNLFDPNTSFADVDWHMDEIADSLICSRQIQPFIIVGIDSTPNRSKEYEPGPLCEAYMDFVIHNLKPFIDKNYRTKPDAKNTAVGGSSAGALVSFMLAWQHPEVFAKVACLSPAFKIEKIDYITPVRNYAGKRKNIKLYIDSGGAGLDSHFLPGIREMVSVLKEKGFKENKNLYVFYDLTAEHNEAAWSKRIATPLKLFFGKRKKL
jgi:enterochelin esterase-like enzyme